MNYLKGLTTHRLITLIAFLGIFAMAARISIDPDTWWHLRAGQWILENRAVPQVDPFSYTRQGAPWQYPGWLVEVPLFWIYRAFGPGGLNLWTAGMVTLTFVFLWRALAGGAFLRAFVIVLAATASAVYWAARPYLVTFLLAAVFVWILEDARWRRSASTLRRLLWLPVLMVLWANSHGGFAVGFLLWGVYFASELAGVVWKWAENRRGLSMQSAEIGNRTVLGYYLGAGVLMVLAVCINPSGPVMLLYPFKTIGIGALQEYIQEWQSPDFHSLNVQPFAWMLLLILAAVGASRRRLALTDFLLVAGFAYLGLLAGRNIALFAVAAAPALARHAGAVLEEIQERWQIFPGGAALSTRPSARAAVLHVSFLAVLALAVLLKLSLVLPAAANQEAWEESLPVAAVEYIRRERPPGRLFNSYNWGGYLLWALPEYPVFIDGRTDLYDDELVDQWLQVIRTEPGWQAALDRWKVRLVLVERDVPLASQLEGQGWQRLFQSEKAVVFGR